MKKRYLAILGIIAIVILIGIPISHLLKTKLNETGFHKDLAQGFTNDESNLNLTQVDTIIPVESTKKEITKQLKNIIQYAKTNKLKISIAGARHSMGGHTIYKNGVIINMLPYKHMKLDTTSNILTIGSGALWEDAIRYLDKFNKSISVMQAFSSFSIGGSLSVNGHGWQKNHPPISSSVVSFTLMNIRGEVIKCSRSNNYQLFKAALGGYGLFGIILDIKLKVVKNTSLEYKYVNMSTDKYLEYYKKYITNNEKTALVFGRLRISKKRFLEEATLNFFEKKALIPKPLPEKNRNSLESKRIVFRGSVDSEYGKKLRWGLEKIANKASKNKIYSRNQLLNDHVSLIENKDTATTDILHEYFIPERNFNKFINNMKPILLNSNIDLLNITIRRIEADTVTIMNYAKETVYGFVILFNQRKTEEQELKMKELTGKLVNITIKNEGTFYLPYRLHIGKDKMRIAYPKANLFFDFKRKHDPNEIFNNQFYKYYK